MIDGLCSHDTWVASSPGVVVTNVIPSTLFRSSEFKASQDCVTQPTECSSAYPAPSRAACGTAATTPAGTVDTEWVMYVVSAESDDELSVMLANGNVPARTDQSMMNAVAQITRCLLWNILS